MTKKLSRSLTKLALGFLAISLFGISSCQEDSNEPIIDNLPNISGYPIVSTNQTKFYGNTGEISAPGINDPRPLQKKSLEKHP